MLAKEAAIIIGAAEAVIIAVIALLAYVLGWDTEFAALLVGVASAAVALVGSILTRGQVYSQESVDKLLSEQE